MTALTTLPHRLLGGSNEASKLLPSPENELIMLLMEETAEEGGSPFRMASIATNESTGMGSDDGDPVPSHKRRNARGVLSLICSAGTGIMAVTMAIRSPQTVW